MSLRIIGIVFLIFLITYPANAKVVIYESPLDIDRIEIYANSTNLSLNLPIKSVERLNNCYVVETTIGEKTGVFERRISSELLKSLSKFGDIYIWIDKGCEVHGKVKLIASDDFQNEFYVLEPEDITYSVSWIVFVSALFLFILFPLLSFVISRFFARSVYKSDKSLEEKMHRFTLFFIAYSILALSFAMFFMIISDVMEIYVMLVGYYLPFEKNTFLIGWIVMVFAIVLLPIVSMLLGCLPYYRRVKGEDIAFKSVAKFAVLFIGVIVGFIAIWSFIIINLPEDFMMNRVFIIVLFVAFLLFIGTVMPNILSIIHRAKPLEGELREEILRLCKSCGVKVSDIRVITDAPERFANAGVNGVLRKYIFLTDYLLKKFDRDEILAVVAHELGHLKERHTLLKDVMFICFFVTWFLVSDWFNLFELGFLKFTVLWFIAFMCFLFLFGRLMVYLEFRADKFAVNVVGKEIYVKMLNRLAELNLAKKRTSSLYTILTFHPSIEERINRICSVENLVS